MHFTFMEAEGLYICQKGFPALVMYFMAKGSACLSSHDSGGGSGSGSGSGSGRQSQSHQQEEDSVNGSDDFAFFGMLDLIGGAVGGTQHVSILYYTILYYVSTVLIQYSISIQKDDK
jgi:hypothetical protein